MMNQEKKINTLAQTLKNSGLAASGSEAVRMAQGIVGTEKKVARSFEKKKKKVDAYLQRKRYNTKQEEIDDLISKTDPSKRDYFVPVSNYNPPGPRKVVEEPFVRAKPFEKGKKEEVMQADRNLSDILIDSKDHPVSDDARLQQEIMEEDAERIYGTLQDREELHEIENKPKIEVSIEERDDQLSTSLQEEDPELPDPFINADIKEDPETREKEETVLRREEMDEQKETIEREAQTDEQEEEIPEYRIMIYDTSEEEKSSEKASPIEAADDAIPSFPDRVEVQEEEVIPLPIPDQELGQTQEPLKSIPSKPAQESGEERCIFNSIRQTNEQEETKKSLPHIDLMDHFNFGR